MAQYADRDRFIPFRKSEIVDLVCQEEGVDTERFRAFCRVLESLYHFQFHARLERLKEHYFPFNPDRDVRTKKSFAPHELSEHEDRLVQELVDVLDGANYEPITDEEIERAMNEESLFKISLFVDRGDFARCVLFRRGEGVQQAEIKKFPWGTKTIDVNMFERVALLVRFKDADYFESRKRKNLGFEPGSMIVKLFKNVPSADLEMLFPNTQVRMTMRDRLTLLLPGVIGGAGVLLKAAASLVAAFAILWALAASQLSTGKFDVQITPQEMAVIVAALVGLGGIGGFMVKQWLAFKNRKIKFMKALTDNLYFKNLDNNEGVFHRLIDGAEEEECKEAMLAYAFLVKHPAGLTEPALDDAIEEWFAERHETLIDFEVDDGLRKLAELGLTEVAGKTPEGEPIYRACDMPEACRRLDEIWDNLFQYANEARDGLAEAG
jgi:hypothetical protein